MPGEPAVTQHCSARWPERGSQMARRLPWSLCHLVQERWEGGGGADSYRGAGIHGEQTAGWDHWQLVDSLYLQSLQQPGRVVGEEGPYGTSGGKSDSDGLVPEVVLRLGLHPLSPQSHQPAFCWDGERPGSGGQRSVPRGKAGTAAGTEGDTGGGAADSGRQGTARQWQGGQILHCCRSLPPPPPQRTSEAKKQRFRGGVGRERSKEYLI